MNAYIILKWLKWRKIYAPSQQPLLTHSLSRSPSLGSTHSVHQMELFVDPLMFFFLLFSLKCMELMMRTKEREWWGWFEGMQEMMMLMMMLVMMIALWVIFPWREKTEHKRYIRVMYVHHQIKLMLITERAREPHFVFHGQSEQWDESTEVCETSESLTQISCIFRVDRKYSFIMRRAEENHSSEWRTFFWAPKKCIHFDAKIVFQMEAHRVQPPERTLSTCLLFNDILRQKSHPEYRFYHQLLGQFSLSVFDCHLDAPLIGCAVKTAQSLCSQQHLKWISSTDILLSSCGWWPRWWRWWWSGWWWSISALITTATNIVFPDHIDIDMHTIDHLYHHHHSHHLFQSFVTLMTSDGIHTIGWLMIGFNSSG